jgi:hypothetical protein
MDGLPTAFWVRNGSSKSAEFTIPAADDLTFATEARMFLATWNGADTGRININGNWQAGGFVSNHFYSLDEFSLPTTALVQEVNTVTISATTVHHGMEVMWPGPMFFVRYGPGGPSAGAAVEAEVAWGEPRGDHGRLILPLSTTGGPSVRSLSLELTAPGLAGMVEDVTSDLAAAGSFRWKANGDRLQVDYAGDRPVELPDPLLELVLDTTGKSLDAVLEANLAFNDGEPVALEKARLTDVPVRFALGDNFPNPFNPVTRISFDLPVTGPVRLTVHDVRGRAVRNLVAGVLSFGTHTAVWNGTDDAGRRVPSGVYFCRIEAGDFVATRKMMLLK